MKTNMTLNLDESLMMGLKNRYWCYPRHNEQPKKGLKELIMATRSNMYDWKSLRVIC